METELMQQGVRLMLPCPHEIHLEALTVDVQQQQVILAVTVKQAAPACPRCQVKSGRIHSHYQRTIADLPWADIRVCLHLAVRKCFCHNPACTQRIFSELLPGLVAPWARRTQRLAEQQRSVGLALGGAASHRLSGCLDCPASRDTFLRLVRTTPTVAMPTPRYIGVDDWALCKGHTYGSIIIDLERSVILDLLPDRTARPSPAGCRSIQVSRLSVETVAEPMPMARRGAHRMRFKWRTVSIYSRTSAMR